MIKKRSKNFDIKVDKLTEKQAKELADKVNLSISKRFLNSAGTKGP